MISYLPVVLFEDPNCVFHQLLHCSVCICILVQQVAKENQELMAKALEQVCTVLPKDGRRKETCVIFDLEG